MKEKKLFEISAMGFDSFVKKNSPQLPMEKFHLRRGGARGSRNTLFFNAGLPHSFCCAWSFFVACCFLLCQLSNELDKQIFEF